MSKKKVLIVTQEMHPYTALSEISNIARKLPQHIQENGMTTNLVEHHQVFGGVAGVFFQIGRFVKLGGVHKNTAYRTLRGSQGLFDEGKMSLMQGAHSRNKADSPVLAPVRFQKLPEGADFFKEIHEY